MSLEQGITGDVLVNLDHESLRDLSILTVGQRMDLLKNIYQLKITFRVPVNEWDYIPPSKNCFLNSREWALDIFLIGVLYETVNEQA